jgi:hypothetical protein
VLLCSYSQHKLSNFAHAHDPFITRITRSAKPLEEMERRVRKCLDVHGRKYGPAWAAYDGKLPPVPGWPRNPVAPLAFNLSFLEREKRMHENEVARLSRTVGKSRAASPPAAAGQEPQESASAFWLKAAFGRLQSTRAAIDQHAREASAEGPG